MPISRGQKGDISQSEEYQSFRCTVPQKTVIVDDVGRKEWRMYDAGPRSVRCPLVCLPPASGAADVFFRQLLTLTAKGYRVITLDYPVYWTIREWCDGFRKLLDHLELDKVHVIGCSLGGFLAQKFAEETPRSQRLASLILCNSFVDTTVFRQTDVAPGFWMMPALVLKKMILGNFSNKAMDADIADSVDFMVEKLDSISREELASRLTLNCVDSYVEPQKLMSIPVTIIDVFDECALTQNVRDEVYKCYPDARRAHLKTGGNFPFLSRSDEVNVIIQIHLKEFIDTRYNAKEYDPRDNAILKERYSTEQLLPPSRPRASDSSQSDSGDDKTPNTTKVEVHTQNYAF